ncbi:MAG: LmbE family protein [Planctomycetes bacterium]|nr:LmbE family protein [Planctomycetota bacterium]
MQLTFKNERVLAVVAHPDDAELLCAGTLARAKSDGATIGICVLCQGDKGQPNPPIDNLVEVRRKEMTAAAKLLGAQLSEGDFCDGELLDEPETRKVVIEQFRCFSPTLVLAHSSKDYHPDHCAASRLAEAASWFSASAGHKTKSPPLESPPALWWMDTINMGGFLPDFYLDIGDYVELKRQMLHCHQSQLARGEDADFSPLETLMVRQCETRGTQAGVQAAEAFCSHAVWKRTHAW